MTLSWMQGLDDGRILYSTYIEALLQALNGKYVLSGLSCSTDGASLNVNIEAGTVRYDGVDYNYAGGSVTLNIGEVDRDRVDVIVWDYNGGSPTISVLQGSRWLNIGGSLKPMSERISDTQIPLALVIVRAGATSIGVTDVYDVRVTADMVAKLSDLQIDADKNWGGRKIQNVGYLSVGGTNYDNVPNLRSALKGANVIADSLVNLDPNSQGDTLISSMPNIPWLLVGWNRQAGIAEIDFIMNRTIRTGTIAVGGFIFWSLTDPTSLDLKKLLHIRGDNGYILPGADNSQDLGSSSLRWANIYGVNVYAGDLYFTGTLTGGVGNFSRLKVNGAEVYTIRVVTVTSNYTASNGDVVLANASAGAITVTLQTPTSGAVINVKKIDGSANAVTIDGAGATIDGQTSIQITTQYESYTLVSDGSNWYII